MAGVPRGRRRELGREAARKGEGRRGTPSSFLACLSRFSRASNPLSLSFRTPATKAINYTLPGSIKAMIGSD